MFLYIFVALIGLAFGSFVNAFVWRLHEQEQIKERHPRPDRGSSNKTVSLTKSENNRLKDLSITKGRSMCPDCGHQLSWKDLIPVLSWLTLRGKCRYCNKRISGQYPLVEVITSIAFAVSLYAWPLQLNSFAEYLLFGIWCASLVLMISLSVYDLKWMILPTKLVYSAGLLALAFVLTLTYIQNDLNVIVSSVIGSIGLGGFFWLLYQISGGKWIGGGDVRLGFVLGAFLGWHKAIVGVSLAAYIGTAIVLIAVLLGKYHRKMKLPFGPLLIAGWYIGFLWGQQIIDWYLRLIGAA